MIAPIVPLAPPPLSPREKDAMTDHDRTIFDAWRYRLHGAVPSENDLMRLYLLGKEQGAKA